MSFEPMKSKDIGRVGSLLGVQDAPVWRCEYLVEKVWKAADMDHRVGDVEFIHGVGNALVNGGADVIWERLLTNAPSTAADAVLSAFSTLAVIGVGDSTAAAAASQTGLQGATSATGRAYSSMAASYPAHTTGTSTAARTAQFRAVFSTAEANFAWGEWGIFNSTAATNRMLNRKAQSLGTKTSAAQWTFTATLTLS